MDIDVLKPNSDPRGKVLILESVCFTDVKHYLCEASKVPVGAKIVSGGNRSYVPN